MKFMIDVLIIKHFAHLSCNQIIFFPSYLLPEIKIIDQMPNAHTSARTETFLSYYLKLSLFSSKLKDLAKKYAMRSWHKPELISFRASQ